LDSCLINSVCKKKKKNIRIYKYVICNLNSINEKYENPDLRYLSGLSKYITSCYFSLYYQEINNFAENLITIFGRSLRGRPCGISVPIYQDSGLIDSVSGSSENVIWLERISGTWGRVRIGTISVGSQIIDINILLGVFRIYISRIRDLICIENLLCATASAVCLRTESDVAKHGLATRPRSIARTVTKVRATKRKERYRRYEKWEKKRELLFARVDIADRVPASWIIEK